MAGGRPWTLWIAIGSVVATFAAAAAIAAAGFTPVSNSSNIKPGDDGSATTECPQGKEAVSGGFAAPGFDPTGKTGPAILPFASRRTTGHGWTAQGHNLSPVPPPDGNGSLVTYAYCDKHQPGLAVRSARTTVDHNDIGTAQARCPTGSEAVSGGFRSPKGGPTAATLFPYVSKRVGNSQWRVSVGSNDNANSHKVTVFVYCDRHEPGLTKESKKGTVQPGDKLTLDIGCGQGSQAFSGGFESTIDFANSSVAFPFTSKRVSTQRWRISALGNGLGHAEKLTAIVYCKG
jgi:hypothetical protein